jgi:hypothetical protein
VNWFLGSLKEELKNGSNRGESQVFCWVLEGLEGGASGVRDFQKLGLALSSTPSNAVDWRRGGRISLVRGQPATEAKKEEGAS